MLFRSDAMIDVLQDAGWGLGHMQVDFSFEILEADASTTRRAFTPTSDFYTPDCDNVDVPVPDEGNVEGETGYACTSDGDCHLLVADWESDELFEMWRADIRGDTFHGGCLAVWDMSRVYGPDGRGDQCTSADAAGYPIAPLLFTVEEVAAGEVDHAIRFILPNTSIRDGEFFHPATHATNAEGGGADTIPYGARLRLRDDFDMESLPSDAARTVARGMQEYGMVLADGGNVTLTAESDARAAMTWESIDFDSHSLDILQPSDFEVVALDGDAVPLTFDCVRE